MAEIPGCLIDRAVPEVERRTGFAVTGHHLTFSGRCADCGEGPDARDRACRRSRRSRACSAGSPCCAARPAAPRDGLCGRGDDRRRPVRDHAGGLRARSRGAGLGRARDPDRDRRLRGARAPDFQHVHVEDTICNPRAAEIGAGGITTHAFLDGLAIGSAFQVSSELGLLVSAAVLLHAFADGLNTVTILLRHGHRHRTAKVWLAADAAAPILGAAIGLLTPLPDPVFAVLLAFFAGMFLYFGAGSLLPQAHRSGRNRVLVVSASAAGIGLAFAAASLA